MSSLVNQLNRMRSSQISEVQELEQAKVEKFRIFYGTQFYREHKASLESRLSALNRIIEMDPAKLIVIQGERVALQGIIDGFEVLEKRCNEALRRA